MMYESFEHSILISFDYKIYSTGTAIDIHNKIVIIVGYKYM